MARDPLLHSHLTVWIVIRLYKKWPIISELGWYLHLKQRKTKLYHVLPITPQAKELLGERFESNRLIFKDFKYSSKTSIELCRWAIAAGVAKRITFHSARHTHATLLLSHGVDIYTVSKLLGHKHVVSTERYAHITDKLKNEAIQKLPLLK